MVCWITSSCSLPTAWFGIRREQKTTKSPERVVRVMMDHVNQLEDVEEHDDSDFLCIMYFLERTGCYPISIVLFVYYVFFLGAYRV